jgi:DivIVA domain-containing protein
MELTPQTLHAVEFREARRGGYNTRDVDDFLERIAQGVGLLQDRLREVMARAESAEGRLSDVQRQLEEVRRRPPAPEVSETDDTLRRTLVLAQRTADATIKEAKDEAARLLGESRDEAARVVSESRDEATRLISEARDEAGRVRAEAEAEARRGTEGARARAEAEIEHLIDTREALNRDIEALGQRMSDQRERVRASIAELERALDEPSFESVPPVPLTEVERPERNGRPGRGDVPAGRPAPGPSLPMRKQSDHEPLNGQAAPEPAMPFLPGGQVGPPEAPPLPSRPVVPDPGPAVSASPFALNGANGSHGPHGPTNGSSRDGGASPVAAPWPSQLRTSLSDEPPPEAAGPSGGEAIGIEPGSRPSEWGRNVFDREPEGERSRYSR